jgi:hypothetical protein
VYEKTGFKQEDEKERNAKEEVVDTGARASQLIVDGDDDIVCGDAVGDEEVSLCDWKNPMMMLESRYKDMATFRLAIRHYTIKNEFELAIEATCPYRFRGYCKGGDCP